MNRTRIQSTTCIYSLFIFIRSHTRKYTHTSHMLNFLTIRVFTCTYTLQVLHTCKPDTESMCAFSLVIVIWGCQGALSLETNTLSNVQLFCGSTHTKCSGYIMYLACTIYYTLYMDMYYILCSIYGHVLYTILHIWTSYTVHCLVTQ
jgi:hypothetical protein